MCTGHPDSWRDRLIMACSTASGVEIIPPHLGRRRGEQEEEEQEKKEEEEDEQERKGRRSRRRT